MAKKAAPAVASETTELATTFAPPSPVVVFQSPDAVDALLKHISEIVESHIPDLTTAKGRDEIKSLAYKVTRTKTALDDAGAELNAERRRLNDVVDAQRRAIRARLDELRDKARAPLDAWEAAEAERQQTIATIMTALDNVSALPGMSAAGIADEISALEDMVFDADVFQEWLPIAVAKKTRALILMRDQLDRAKQVEADAAELAQLRQADEERRTREAAEQAQREADEAARVAEETRKREETEADQRRKDAEAETERKRLQDIADAEERARTEAREAAEREAQRKIDEANAEAQRLRDEQAVRDAETKRLADEQEARDKDRKHRGEVMKAAKEAIMQHSGVAEEAARKIVLAIVANEVPNVTLRF